MMKLTLKCSLSDRSSNSVAAANYLSPQNTQSLPVEPKVSIVQLKEQQQVPKAMATASVTDPPVPEPTAPEGTVGSPTDPGSLSLIGEGAKIKFPKALWAVGGAKVLSLMKYCKGIPTQYLSFHLSLDCSIEYVLLKSLSMAESNGVI